jgi:uncharacterized integral membrane protein (TIGR00698 family)
MKHAWRVWPLVGVAVASVLLVPQTPLRVLGPLTVALLLGMAIRPLPIVRAIGPESVMWLSREVLRAGVVLVGVRLDWVLLARAGAGPLVIAATAVVVGLALFAVLLRVLGVPRRLGALLAIGSSVCGAAAITAARPVVGAADEEANVGIAIVSVLGALASLALVVAHGAGWLGEATYGLVAGGALHEVAHVMAAATAAPAALGIATVTKLARVALLPVALVAMPWLAGREGRGERARFRVPPLVVWFLVASAAATLIGHAGLPPAAARAWTLVATGVSQLATIMLASSMVAIGALVDWASLRRAGVRPLVMAVVGALLLGLAVLGVASRV